MLSDACLEKILAAIPRLSVGVLGDLFLDRYLDIDGTLTERSLETGRDAYQVVGVRPTPGAAGTIINNLVALGVKRVAALSVIGDDGEGYELLWALKNYHVVDSRTIYSATGWRTPTYTKPMLRERDQPPRELDRFDIKNYQALRSETEDLLLRSLSKVWPRLDALLALDQIAPPAHGVITERIVERLAELGESEPQKPILTDSRSRIGMFRSVWLKPNRAECMHAIRQIVPGGGTTETCAADLAQHTGRPVFCTCGEEGMIVVDPVSKPPAVTAIPAFPVTGPIDIVGAGDSVAAAVACAVAAGASLVEAGAFATLVASITIQQLGTTGTATPEQIRETFRRVSA